MVIRLETSIQHTYLALAIVLIILTVLVTCVRFWSRHLSRANIGIDDWLALAAVVFYVGEVALHLWSMLAGGVGIHVGDVAKEQLSLALKSLTIVEYPYTAALTCIRISIILLLKRIFVQKWFKYSAYALVFLNVSWLIFIYFDAALICRPFKYNWDQTISGTCGDKPQSYIVMAVWGIVIDAATWSLPLFIIWRLKSSMSKKVELSALFALGLFDIAVSIVRIVQLENLDFTGDFTYTVAPVQIWSFLEAGVAIIIGNAPSCRQAVQQFFGFAKSRTPSKQANYVFSANRSSKKPTDGNATSRDDDDMHLWPVGMTTTAYATSNRKSFSEDSTTLASSDRVEDEESGRDHKSVAISQEVWLSQKPAA